MSVAGKERGDAPGHRVPEIAEPPRFDANRLYLSPSPATTAAPRSRRTGGTTTVTSSQVRVPEPRLRRDPRGCATGVNGALHRRRHGGRVVVCFQLACAVRG